MAAHDDDAAAEIAEPIIAEKASDRVGRRYRILAVQTKDGNPGMGTRWVATDVSEPSVQRDEEALGTCRCPQDARIISSGYPLVLYGVDVVSERRCRLSCVCRQILVELDLQPGAGSSG